jgi:hypothetical protein
VKANGGWPDTSRDVCGVAWSLSPLMGTGRKAAIDGLDDAPAISDTPSVSRGENATD